MTIEMRCFAELPFELGDEILLYVVWALAESDKPTLSALVASRRTLSVVRPALYDTVCITAANLESVVAAIPFGYFSRTRRLWFVDSPGFTEDIYASEIGNAFCNVQDFAGGLRCVDYYWVLRCQLRRARVMVRWSDVEMRSHVWLLVRPSLAHVTHLRLRVDSSEDNAPYIGGRVINPALGLQHVLLESATPHWNLQTFLESILPFFLSGAHIQRVVVCATPHAADLPELYAALEACAHAHRERRLWVLDAPKDGSLTAQFMSGVTVADEQWTAGRPIITVTHWQ